jgi:hypothetical protein
LVFGFAAATLVTWDFFLAVAGFAAGIALFPPAAGAVVLPGLAIAARLLTDADDPAPFFFFFLRTGCLFTL